MPVFKRLFFKKKRRDFSNSFSIRSPIDTPQLCLETNEDILSYDRGVYKAIIRAALVLVRIEKTVQNEDLIARGIVFRTF